MKNFAKEIHKAKELYSDLIDYCAKQKQSITHITDPKLFNEVLQCFGPVLDQKKATVDLSSLYTVSVHNKTQSLIISNKGATLFCLSPLTRTPYITRHMGCAVYRPNLGVEFVNIGLIGNIYNEKVIIRSESACTPSFIFGSQRCNCAHQWDSIREIAAQINPITVPDNMCGYDFEKWVQKQFVYKDGTHLPTQDGTGIILMHVDTQNGMGSGFTKERFAFDLFTVSSLRHRGEYSAEQIHGTTMKGGFEAIGINPDPRSDNDNIGYKVTYILLDWLNCNKNILMLSNNLKKIEELENNNYKVQRIKTLGAINKAGAEEAKQRGTEFLHLDINENEISIEVEIQRLLDEINKHHTKC